MRLAYVKAGDVVTSLRKILEPGARMTRASPLAFQAAMIKVAGPNPLLLLSVADREIGLSHHNILAKTLRERALVPGSFGRRLALTGLGRRITKAIESFEADVVVCGCLGLVLESCLQAGSKRRIPTIVSLHNRIDDRLDRERLLRADAWICHGPYLRKLLVDLGVPTERLFEFELPVDLPEIKPGRETSKTKTILFVGRVEAPKGVFDLLEATAPLLQEYGQWQLVFVGGGPDLTKIESRIQEAGLKTRVFCTGMIPHEEALQSIGRAAVVVTPTQSVFAEGRCMAAAEALLLGVPVIAPNFGPFPYLVSNEQNGLLYKSDSILDLRSCLARIMRDPVLLSTLAKSASGFRMEFASRPSRDFEQALRASLAAVGKAPPA